MPRKPSPRSPLKTLDDSIQDRLAEFLVKGTLADGVDYCRTELGIKTNDSSLSEWFCWWKMMQKLNHFSASTDDLRAELADKGTDPDLVAKLGDYYFMAKAAEAGDVKMFATVASVVQRHQELKAQQAAHADKMDVAARQIEVRKENIKLLKRRVEAAERKVEALEKKNELAMASASKAKDILNSGGLTDEARNQLMITMDEMILGVKKKPAAKQDKPAEAAPTP